MLILGTNAYNPTIMNNTTSGGGSDIPTTLGSRIDNKATVVGVLQDHEGNDYVLAVVDAAYRSGEAIGWGSKFDDSILQDYSNLTAVLADHHTGKYNTDLILSTYSTGYTAFRFAKNACTVSIGNNTYYSVLPSMNELQLLYDNKDVLDQYDPTASTYTDRTMSGFTCGGSAGLWSSNEYAVRSSWFIKNNGSKYENDKVGSYCGVCPVICIPLS